MNNQLYFNLNFIYKQEYEIKNFFISHIRLIRIDFVRLNSIF